MEQLLNALLRFETIILTTLLYDPYLTIYSAADGNIRINTVSIQVI